MKHRKPTHLEFQQALALVKDTYRDWWNHSWIPAKEYAIIASLSIFFSQDDKSGGLMPYDQGGATPSLNTWREINQAVEQFYASNDSDFIDEANWFNLAHKHLPSRTELPQRIPKGGYVYLLKGGGYYKIGLSRNVYRRWREVSPKLPFEVEIVCTIATDDMHKLETTLHKRFADKRENGEWFKLDDSDVEYVLELAG